MLRTSGRTPLGGASAIIRRLAGGDRRMDLGGSRHHRWIHHDRSRRSARPTAAPCAIATPSCSDDDQISPNSNRHFLAPRRSFGLYRRPHQRDLRVPPEPDLFDDGDVSLSDLKTADDMEDYDFLTDDYHPHDDDQQEQDEEARIESDLEAERRAQAVRDELDRRTGRLWTDPWEITEQDWFDGKKYDDLPDWSPELCSRVSLERVKVLEGGIPTLSTISRLPLPPPQPPHPSSSDPQPYLKHSSRKIRSTVAAAVEAEAAPEIERILSLRTWEEKQDAVDELFENVEETLRSKKSDGTMDVLSAQPMFGDWVEDALEIYLKQVVRKEETESEQSAVEGEKEGDVAADDSSADKESPAKSDTTSRISPTPDDDEAAIPAFVDLMGGVSKDAEGGGGVNDMGAPDIVHPLRSHSEESSGRMVEEWELAANKKTKRIMVRQCIRHIAQALEEADREDGEGVARRIYVKGRKGTGKTAALAAAVASARASGNIVLYLPDGDRLRKLGKYIRPNVHRDGNLFDLPVLAKEVCDQLLHSHGKDLDDMVASMDLVKKFLGEDEIRKVVSAKENDGTAVGHDNDIPLSDLLRGGADSTTLSSGCYGAVVDALMDQTSKSFFVVMDEFNCYFDYGEYFHEEYDPDVRRAIPCDRITLFKPLLDAMGIAKADDRKGLPQTRNPVLMKRGAILVGITESRAVARKFTEAITETMVEQEENQAGVRVVDVPQFSPVEVDHILANFEVTGIGRLRFDRGKTVMDEQEVAYLRMVSGGVGQNLLDACII